LEVEYLVAVHLPLKLPETARDVCPGCLLRATEPRGDLLIGEALEDPRLDRLAPHR
jgi:hypothetical protein